MGWDTVEQSTNNQCKQTTRSNARKYGISLLLLATALIATLTQFSNYGLQSQISFLKQKIIDFQESATDSSNRCSGHGVSISNSRCLCDLGYGGPTCAEAMSTELAASSSNNVLLVAENFASLNAGKDITSENTLVLSTQLRDNGYQVSVLYVGEDNKSFSRIQRELLKENIKLIRLTDYATGLSYGENRIEERAYEVYQFLLKSDPYAIVHFSAESGAGYYTLMAQDQGLICFKTKFVVTMNTLPVADLESIESNNPDNLITNIDVLKRDHVHRRSAELAKHLVLSSQLLLDEIQSREWDINSAKSHVIGMIPRTVQGHRNAEDLTTVKELVFAGELSLRQGISVFTESIDILSSELQDLNIIVTFIGMSTDIEGMEPEEWIELHVSGWEEFGVKWNYIPASSEQEILEYLGAKDGRVAVLPALFDSTSVISIDLLYSGIPFISSTRSAIKDLISPESIKNLIEPIPISLSRQLKEVLDQKIELSKPLLSKSGSVDSWIDLHQKLTSIEVTCPAASDEVDLPLVSVVLVHHNRGEWLKQAVESIESQTYPNIEVILVDDGSTDRESIRIMESITWNWWENKGWKVIREKNRYLGAARNIGVKHAIGKYVVFMDDDDIAKPHQVETLVKVAMKKDAEVVTSGHDVFVGKAGPINERSITRYVPLGAAKLAGILQNVFGDSKFLVDRESFIHAGGFTEDFGVGFEDYEFLAKMVLQNRRFEAVSESLNWYRRHDHAMSYMTNLKSNQHRMLRAYHENAESALPMQQALLDFAEETFFHDIDARQLVPSANNSTATATTSDVVSTPIPTICDSDNSNCRALFGLEPPVVPNRSGTKISVAGFGLVVDDVISVMIGNTLIPSSDIAVTDISISFGLINNLPYNINAKHGSVKIMVEYRGFNFPHVFTLTYFDPNKVFLERVDPAIVPASLNGALTLVGVGLAPPLDISKAICVYNINNRFSSGPIFFVENSGLNGRDLVICRGLVAPDPDTEISVDLMFSTPKYSVSPYPDLTDLNRPQYFVPKTVPKITAQTAATAPYITKAEFSGDGSRITVYFDSKIQIFASQFVTTLAQPQADGTYQCASIFQTSSSDTTVGKLMRTADNGDDCKFTFLTRSSIEIILDPAFATTDPDAIIPYEKLALIGNIISQAGFNNAFRNVAGTSVVYPPNPPLPPQAAIQGPSLVGNCSDVIIDISQSSGSGGRPWTSVVLSLLNPSSTIDDTTNESVDAPLMTHLETANAQFVSGRTEFIINAPFLKEARTYMFSVTFTTFLTGMADAVLSVQRLEQELPYVVVVGDFGLKDIPVYEVNTITARSLPTCQQAQAKKTFFEWSFILTGDLSIIPAISKPTAASIAFPEFSFLPNTDYKLRLKYGYSLNDMVSIEVDIHTRIDTIFGSAGSHGRVGDGNTVIKKAVVSSNGYKTHLRELFVCTWSCQNVFTGGFCMDGNGVVLDLSTSTCEAADVSGKLAAGSTYKLDVQISNIQTGATVTGDFAYLEVVSGTVPIVNIKASDLRPGSWSESFNMATVVEPGTSTGSLTYLWSSPVDCFGMTFSGIDLMIESTTQTQPSNKILKFIPGKLVPGATYCHKVTVTDANNNVGEASIFLPVRQRPIGGICSVSVPAGTGAFTNDVSFICQYWSTDPLSYPMRYTHQVKRITAARWTTLVSLHSSTVFRAKMPPGTFEVYSTIQDSADSINQVMVSTRINIAQSVVKRSSIGEKSMELNKRQASPSADAQLALIFVSNAQTQFGNDGDANALLQAASSAVLAIPDEDSSSVDGETIGTAVLNAQMEAIAVLYPDTKKTIPSVANLLRSVAGQVPRLKTSFVDKLFTSLAATVKIVDDANPTTCYSSGTTTDFISIADSSIRSLAASNETESTEVSRNLGGVITTLQQCQLRTRVCGQSQYEYIGGGIVYSAQISTTGSGLCSNHYTIQNLGSNPPIADTCISHGCTFIDGEGLLPDSGNIQSDVQNLSGDDILAFQQNFISLKLYNDNGDPVTLQDATIQVSIAVNTPMLEQFGIANTIEPVENKQIFAGQFSEASDMKSYKISSVYTMNSVDSPSFQFLASRPGEFSVGVRDLTPVTPPGSTNGGLPTGAIVGIVVGAALVLAVVAGVAFLMRKRTDKSERAPPVVAVAENVAIPVQESAPVVLAAAAIPPPPSGPVREANMLPEYQYPPTYANYMSAQEEYRIEMDDVDGNNDYGEDGDLAIEMDGQQDEYRDSYQDNDDQYRDD